MFDGGNYHIIDMLRKESVVVQSLILRKIAKVYTMEFQESGNILGVLSDVSIRIEDGVITWIGPDKEAPSAQDSIHAEGLVAMPGLVDCHTHSVWGGSRSDEFRRRLAGESYTAILEEGGGILSTVAQTRAASDQSLAETFEERLRVMLSHGVTTLEVKSGYGLTPQDERRMLAIARSVGERVGVRIVTTFLGAHAVPREYRGRREAYVDHVITEQLPAVLDVADCIDVYVDRGAFTVDEGRRILTAGKEAGLRPRIHAEQVVFTGAAKMAAELGALSADHLERIDSEGIQAMADAGTVAVLLPGAMLYLKDPSPPVEALRKANVPMAVATDFNPGSSPVIDLWACATLACVTMGLTVEEAMLGITRIAAMALGRSDLGILKVGGPADIALFKPLPGESSDATGFVQHLTGPKAERVIRGGRIIL